LDGLWGDSAVLVRRIDSAWSFQGDSNRRIRQGGVWWHNIDIGSFATVGEEISNVLASLLVLIKITDERSFSVEEFPWAEVLDKLLPFLPFTTGFRIDGDGIVSQDGSIALNVSHILRWVFLSLKDVPVTAQADSIFLGGRVMELTVLFQLVAILVLVRSDAQRCVLVFICKSNREVSASSLYIAKKLLELSRTNENVNARELAYVDGRWSELTLLSPHRFSPKVRQRKRHPKWSADEKLYH
jgi:hypothetical protein